MPDTPALPPLPDLDAMKDALSGILLTPVGEQVLALIAHVRALREENDALKRVLADLNNVHRHKFSEAVAAAEDALFKACSYNATARAALAASQREG